MKRNIEHPFIKTIGQGPYKLVGLFVLQIPSASNGFRNNYADIPKGVGVGTCAHCGMGIIYNYIIQSANGKSHAVGCECVKKLDLPYGEKSRFEKMVAEQAAEKRRARSDEKGKAARKLLESLLNEYADLLKSKTYNYRSSYFDYISFCIKNMGNTNIQRLAKIVEKMVEKA
jgi:hypothetical protein